MQETQEMQVRYLGQEDALEKEMATHSTILAWDIPWTEKPGRLQSMGLQRVGHNWVHTHFPLIISFDTEKLYNISDFLSLLFR